MKPRVVVPVRIPDAAYDAIVMAITEPALPHVLGGVINAQHFIVWPDLSEPDVVIALVRGEEQL